MIYIPKTGGRWYRLGVRPFRTKQIDNDDENESDHDLEFSQESLTSTSD
jgi:hypothetical protein